MNKKLVVFGIGILFLIALWEVFSCQFPRLFFVLPAPSRIFLSLVESYDRFIFHSLSTLKEICGGFCLAAAAAFPLAWIMLRFELTRTLLQPLFVIIQCLPMFTLAPIMVFWFGWGYTAIVVPTALMIFFPLTLNIYQGLRSTPPEMLEFFQLNQATEWQILFKLRLPWALPHLFSGLRISAAIAGIGAIAGEWAGAQKGLGILMLESRRNTDLEITFGALFCLMLLSMLLYSLILFLEKLILRKPYLHRILVILIACFLFSGCEQKQSAQTTRLLLDWLPNPSHVPLYAGMEKGFFEEEGIHLSIQKMYEEGGGISYLTSGKVDLFIYHMPGVLRAYSQGAKVQIVGCLIKKPLRALIYHSDPAVRSLSDLSGKILGYCIGGPNTAFLDYLLQEGNINPSQKKNVSVDLISAMGTHSVDFIYGGYWNIEPQQLMSLGVPVDFFRIEEMGVPDYYEMIIIAQEGSKEAERGFCAAFQKALQKSIDYCRENPEQAFVSYLRFHPDKRLKTVKWEKKAWKMTLPLFANSQQVDRQLLKTFYLWQKEHGLLAQDINPETLLTSYE